MKLFYSKLFVFSLGRKIILFIYFCIFILLL